jgi:hypothetical protein
MSEEVTGFVKTSGIGFEVTVNEAEAAVFSTEAKAKEYADRLKKQFLKYRIWEVVPCARGFCIRLTSQKASRAGKWTGVESGMANQPPTKPRELSKALNDAQEEMKKNPPPPDPNSLLDRIPVRKK